MKTVKALLLTGLLCTVVTGVALPVAAQDKVEKKGKTEDKAKGEAKKRDTLPAGGKIKSVDKANKTLTVGDRVFAITSETRLTKDGKPATLEDAKDGEEVGISYRKGEDGKLTAMSVRIGPRPETVKKNGDKKP
jgi:hypothetical protein